jgi:Ankyrin repeats (3 copies)
MPLKNFEDCRQAIQLGDANALSAVNARGNDNEQSKVLYTKEQYRALVVEALKKFKGDKGQLDVVKENIDFGYLPKGVSLESLLNLAGVGQPKNWTSIDKDSLGVVISMLGKNEAGRLAVTHKTFNARFNAKDVQHQLYAQELRDGIQALNPNASPKILWNNPLNRKPLFWNMPHGFERSLPDLCRVLCQVPGADKPDKMKAWRNSVYLQLQANGHQALSIASGYGHIETVDLLLNAYPNDGYRLQALKANDHSALRCASRHLETVRLLLNAYPNDGYRLQALKARGLLARALANGLQTEVLDFLRKEEKRITDSPYKFFVSSTGSVDTHVELGFRRDIRNHRYRYQMRPNGMNRPPSFY